MATVFLVWHVYQMDDTGEDETKFAGVYSTKATAVRAVVELKAQPGFRDHPDSFEIHEYTVDEPQWTEGFVTVRPGEE